MWCWTGRGHYSGNLFREGSLHDSVNFVCPQSTRMPIRQVIKRIDKSAQEMGDQREASSLRGSSGQRL